jgi:alkylated DNA nucleotide flippase Atl1
MQVNETTLQALLGGSKQFRVPLFQRTYTWKDRDHSQLWRDILAQYEVAKSGAHTGAETSHFIGSFVLAPSDAASATLPTFLVVDGQQRLTTLTLALAAVRDVAAAEDDQAMVRVSNQYLLNPYADVAEDRWKFIPTQDDREEYFACIKGHGAGAGAGRGLISKAYRFFAAQLALPGPDDEPLDLKLLETVIVSRLAIVDITAQAGDNVHRIFESLNATGVGLTQADLLRNYLFMLLPTRDRVVYDEVWLPMQKLLGAEHLEGLARVDLRRRGIDVRDDDVYRSQQNRIRPIEGDEAAVEAEIRGLALRARHYKRIIDPAAEEHTEIHKRLKFLARWRATTTHPFLMYLYDLRERGELTADEMAEVLLNLESFLVRRLLVGAAGKNLNRVFIRLVGQVDQRSGSVLDSVRYHLSTEQKFWGSDDEIRDAARKKPFFFYGRTEQRRMILERIEESYGHRELAELSKLDLSQEHILPQTLSAEWVTELTAAGEDATEVHRELVHTLGNITLTAYNSQLSNHPFERKQQIYDESHLKLNKDLLAHDHWGRAEIDGRADELAEKIIEIWPAPVPGASETSDGFDWSRVDAAIASIPDGRWTAYADLAALAGTAAQAVGNHVSRHTTIPTAYRVLTWDGRVADNFAWHDPNDRRVPLEVLAAEGINFDSSGKASQEQRLSTDDLQALIGWFDPDDDFPDDAE